MKGYVWLSDVTRESEKIEGPVPGRYNAGGHRGGNLFNVRSIESEHMYSPDLKACTSTPPALKLISVSGLGFVCIAWNFLSPWSTASRVQASTCGCWFPQVSSLASWCYSPTESTRRASLRLLDVPAVTMVTASDTGRSERSWKEVSVEGKCWGSGILWGWMSSQDFLCNNRKIFRARRRLCSVIWGQHKGYLTLPAFQMEFWLCDDNFGILYVCFSAVKDISSLPLLRHPSTKKNPLPVCITGVFNYTTLLGLRIHSSDVESEVAVSPAEEVMRNRDMLTISTHI